MAGIGEDKHETQRPDAGKGLSKGKDYKGAIYSDFRELDGEREERERSNRYVGDLWG